MRPSAYAFAHSLRPSSAAWTSVCAFITAPEAGRCEDESIDELAAFQGLGAEVAALTARWRHYTLLFSLKSSHFCASTQRGLHSRC